MPIPGKKYRFTEENVDNSPDEKGVYALFNGDGLIYYGRALGVETIRSRLQSHRSGREGSCTKNATHYKRVVVDDPAACEVELLREFKRWHGKLPRCNSRIG